MTTSPRLQDASTQTVKIGGACAFIADSVLGPRQLVQVPGMQYLVFDYLAEMTLSSFAQTRAANPQAGYAMEFVDTLREILPACAERGIKLVSNGGGVNPAGCARAVQALQQELGTDLRVAYIDGDDCMHLLDELRQSDARDFYDGSEMPSKLDSANVYLGAFPIAHALSMGADIVITGRIVDSATTLGVLISEFGWRPTDYDLLSAGSLAGHILECGCQATGGTHTDWRDVPDWENSGYPIVEFDGNGTFRVTKPEGTGGLVNVATVSEQVLYEVGDPAHYILPDVVCDFTGVTVVPCGPDCVEVSGARGSAPPPTYKLSATYHSGWRSAAQLSIFGMEAVDKATRTGTALLNRVRTLMHEAGHADFDKTHVTVLGAEQSYGPHARQIDVREAIARVAVMHASKDALAIFAREARAPGVSWAPGTTSGSALTVNGKPAIEPVYRLFSCLVDKTMLRAPRVVLGEESVDVPVSIPRDAPSSGKPGDAQAAQAAVVPQGASVRLIDVAYARCGDKGNLSNIAVFARRPDDFEALGAALQPGMVADYLSHLVKGPVVRYEVPGLNAFNFVLEQALDGGGPTSLRPDPLGKGMAQMLLGMEIVMPR